MLTLCHPFVAIDTETLSAMADIFFFLASATTVPGDIRITLAYVRMGKEAPDNVTVQRYMVNNGPYFNTQCVRCSSWDELNQKRDFQTFPTYVNNFLKGKAQNFRTLTNNKDMMEALIGQDRVILQGKKNTLVVMNNISYKQGTFVYGKGVHFVKENYYVKLSHEPDYLDSACCQFGLWSFLITLIHQDYSRQAGQSKSMSNFSVNLLSPKPQSPLKKSMPDLSQLQRIAAEQVVVVSGGAQDLRSKRKRPADEEPVQRSNSNEAFYHLDPRLTGLVVAIIQTEDRPGWELDRHFINKTFQGLLKCEVEIHLNVDARGVENILRRVRCARNEYNYLLTIVSGHGGQDERGEFVEHRRTETIEDWRTSKLMKTTGIVKPKTNRIVQRIYLKTFKDFIKGAHLEVFSEKPKILLWQCCRGTRTTGRKSSFVTEYVKDMAVPDDAPAASDYAIIYASDRGNVAYRHPNEGSTLIQLFSRTINHEPTLEFTAIFHKIKQDSKYMRMPNERNELKDAITFNMKYVLDKRFQFKSHE